jgi:similar to spore coat protein
MDYVLHEVLEVQEMAAFKTNCLTKSKTMRALVSDEKLKRIMEQDVQTSTRQLEEFSAILSKAKQT